MTPVADFNDAGLMFQAAEQDLGLGDRPGASGGRRAVRRTSRPAVTSDGNVRTRAQLSPGLPAESARLAAAACVAAVAPRRAETFRQGSAFAVSKATREDASEPMTAPRRLLPIGRGEAPQKGCAGWTASLRSVRVFQLRPCRSSLRRPACRACAQSGVPLLQSALKSDQRLLRSHRVSASTLWLSRSSLQ